MDRQIDGRQPRAADARALGDTVTAVIKGRGCYIGLLYREFTAVI